MDPGEAEKLTLLSSGPYANFTSLTELVGLLPDGLRRNASYTLKLTGVRTSPSPGTSTSFGLQTLSGIAATSCAAPSPRLAGTGEFGTPRWIRRTRAQMSSASKGSADARSA